MCLNKNTLNLGKFSHMLSFAFEAQLWTRFWQDELKTIHEKLQLLQMQGHTRKVEGMCLAEGKCLIIPQFIFNWTVILHSFFVVVVLLVLQPTGFKFKNNNPKVNVQTFSFSLKCMYIYTASSISIFVILPLFNTTIDLKDQDMMEVSKFRFDSKLNKTIIPIITIFTQSHHFQRLKSNWTIDK